MPFWNIPDPVLYSLIGEKNRRLERPEDAETIQNGMTDEMWALIWECSTPDPNGRPSAFEVSSKTKDLATSWTPRSAAEIYSTLLSSRCVRTEYS